MTKSAELIAGKYRVRTKLGEGGMAEVWSAINVRTGREFAIKLILPSLYRNQEAIDRFFLEAEAVGRLRHPSIVDVFDVGRTREGRPFLVMELLRGETLEQRLERKKTLSALETCTLISQLARALALAHQAGVVHRDLSTANVFFSLSTDGTEVPKVLDFGVSKIADDRLGDRVKTGDGAVLGSPAYMSPEQARGAENVDHQSDVWSLGVLAYECSSGRTPFVGANYNALMLAIVTVPHRPVNELVRDIDPELASVIESCLVKDRAHRTESALVLSAELEAVARRIARGRRVAGPSRRVTDRLPDSRTGGARLWQQLVTLRPTAGKVVGGVGTTALGIALGVAIAGGGQKESPSSATHSPPAAVPAPPQSPSSTSCTQRLADSESHRTSAVPCQRPHSRSWRRASPRKLRHARIRTDRSASIGRS
jgi:serine/threonine protein kinase